MLLDYSIEIRICRLNSLDFARSKHARKAWLCIAPELKTCMRTLFDSSCVKGFRLSAGSHPKGPVPL